MVLGVPIFKHFRVNDTDITVLQSILFECHFEYDTCTCLLTIRLAFTH